MSPALTDYVALAGVDVVVCAFLLWLPVSRFLAHHRLKWLAAAVFVLLWIPAGAAHLPLVAFVRGITSDFSVTLVALSCLAIHARLSAPRATDARERRAVYLCVAAAAFFLYPMALGLGDWDPYRLGWGSAGMLATLLVLSVGCVVAGLTWLPLLVCLSLLAWFFGAMESTNLWDHLMDPWLAMISIASTLNGCVRWLLSRLKVKGNVALPA